MGRKRKSSPTFGTPTFFILYRTPSGWRFSIGFPAPDGIACGALEDLETGCEPEAAQAALHRLAEDLSGRALEVAWQAADQPDWWNGAVTTAGLALEK